MRYRVLIRPWLVLVLALAQVVLANPSAMIQALLGVASPMSPAVLIDQPSGTYFHPYLNVTISTAGGSAYFKSKVGLAANTDCSSSTGYGVETQIADSTPNYLFTSQTPSSEYTDGGTAYELGMQFETNFSGKITGMRYYRTSSEGGSHTGHLWDEDQTLLATVNFSGETASGWQQATFASPVNIVPGRTYMVSSNIHSHYPSEVSGLATSISNGEIYSLAASSNGAFTTSVGSYPSSTYSQSNYFRDIRFVRTSHIVNDLSGLVGNNLKLCVVVRDSAGNWQGFGEATQATWFQAFRLLGSGQLNGGDDSNVSQSAEAFQFVASGTGTASKVRVFVRPGNSASQMIVGIYSDLSNSPNTLLSTGSITSPTSNSWNDVSLGSSVSIASGTKYWIAILGTGGTLTFYSGLNGGGSPSCMSLATNLNSLPSTWSSGSCQSDSMASMFAY